MVYDHSPGTIVNSGQEKNYRKSVKTTKHIKLAINQYFLDVAQFDASIIFIK